MKKNHGGNSGRKLENKQLKYWVFILLLSYGPAIVFPYLIRPMWFKEVDSYTRATIIQFLFTIIFLPVYLLLINYMLTRKYAEFSTAFILNGLIICSCIFISSHLHFMNWADSIGSVQYPDSATRDVMAFERTAGIIVSMIGLGVIWFKERKE
jgi:hypothetical protein